MAEIFTYDNLIGGNAQLITDEMTIVSGAGALKRGTVLGKITASGKGTTVQSDGTDDGRRTPYAILAADTDATSEDKKAPVFKAGEFNANALVFGGTDTAATHKEALRDLGIFVKTSVAD